MELEVCVLGLRAWEQFGAHTDDPFVVRKLHCLYTGVLYRRQIVPGVTNLPNEFILIKKKLEALDSAIFKIDVY